jgi:hypothetical protein
MSATSNQRTSRRQRQRWRRIVVDVLLLPPALLFVLVENVFWAGAKTFLRAAARVESVTAAQRKLARLPAAAVIPLFLIPEVLSHLGGLAATVLLVQGKFWLAVAIGVFVKGFATLMTVWIYQNCAPALLSVQWFAWLHGKALQGWAWVAERMKPARAFALRLITTSRSGMTRRFRALRLRLARNMGLPKR